MHNTYGEIKDEFKYVADILEEQGFTYWAYQNGVHYNAEDKAGVIQSFYPTTGTILLHRSNDRADSTTCTIRGGDLKQFINLLNNPDEIQSNFR